MKSSIVVVLIVMCSCSTLKKSQRQEQHMFRESAVTAAQSWQYSIVRDSSSRYWYLQSDSLLYVHPDRGVWAQGGLLYLQERQGFRREEHFRSRDSSSNVSDTYYNNEVKERQQKGNSSWYLYVGLVLTAVLLLFLLGKRF